MKKIQIFTLAALLLGFASCSKEHEIGNGGDQDGTSGFQITIKASKGVMTYSDPIAIDEEWNFGDVDVYIFDKVSGELLGTTGDFIPAGGGANNTSAGSVTLASRSSWINEIASKLGPDRLVNAYFVGNNAEANVFAGGRHILATEAVKDVTKEEDFIELLAIEQPVDLVDDKAELLKPRLLFSASQRDIKIPTSGLVEANVTLRRREARFDIVNDKQDKLEVKAVYVTNANTTGFIFGAATGMDAMGDPISIANSSLKTINVVESYTLPHNGDPDILQPSVFYLYPTQLGASNTVITIAADYEGKSTLFEVQSTARIEANKRYKLVFDIASLVFHVVVADYDEGIEMPFVEAAGRGLMGLTRTSGSAGTLSNNSFELIGGNAVLKAELGAVSPLGFDVTVTGTGTSIVNQALLNASPAQSVASVPTYGSAFYPTTVNMAITCPATPVAGTEVFVTFTDKSNPLNTATILLYAGTNHTPKAKSNSFMVKPGSAPIAIPLSRVYDHWATLSATAEFDAELLWTDNSNGMKANSAISGAYIQGKGKTAVLLVTPGSGEGNAVVAIRDRDSKDIKWSFHIWNTDYDPAVAGATYEYASTATGTAATHPGAGKTTTFMDRNLGAFNAEPGDEGSFGLLYQWGRKDAFWSPAVWGNTERSMFNATGGAVNISKQDVVEEAANGINANVPTVLSGDNTANNLDYAIENPLAFLFSSEDYNPGVRRDWYTIGSDVAAQKNDLWVDASGKTMYDPCPEGYRVHENGAYEGLTIANFPWSASQYGRFGTKATAPGDLVNTTADTGVASTPSVSVGYYPASGARNSDFGSFTNVGTGGYAWSSTAVATGNSYYLNFSATSVNTSVSAVRATGLPVRCVVN